MRHSVETEAIANGHLVHETHENNGKFVRTTTFTPDGPPKVKVDVDMQALGKDNTGSRGLAGVKNILDNPITTRARRNF